MKLSPITYYQTSSNTSFGGMTKRMKRQIFVDGKKDIMEMLEEKQPKNQTVGSLPPAIFYKIPQENREAHIKNILKAFETASDQIREFKKGSGATPDENRYWRPNSSVKVIKDALVQASVLKEDDPFDLRFIGLGEYKKAYKIEGLKDPKTDEELCMKVFHIVDKSPEWHKYKTHGNYAELNTSIYWKNQEGLYTQRGKFWFGNMEHGYFVDMFVDQNVKPPQRIVEEYSKGLKPTDAVKEDVGHNKLYGYAFDPGGLRVVNRIKNKSKTAEMILADIRRTPDKYRDYEWYKIFANKKLDKSAKEAGLALCVKHVNDKEGILKECLKFNNPEADQALAYALKYMERKHATKYFEVLMKRNNPITQIVLLNEIPLLSRQRSDNANYDDLDIPKDEININRLTKFYYLAKALALPEAEEHLASYIHLLPKDLMFTEAEDLISKGKYRINDRILHKIRYVKDEDFAFSDKMEIIKMLEKADLPDFLKEKTKNVKVRIIRDQLED